MNPQKHTPELVEAALIWAAEGLRGMHGGIVRSHLEHHVRSPLTNTECDFESAKILRSHIAALTEEIETLEQRHAATMMHTQTVVDENNFFKSQLDLFDGAEEMEPQIKRYSLLTGEPQCNVYDFSTPLGARVFIVRLKQEGEVKS